MTALVPHEPHHIQATRDDLAGNQGIGRFVFLPGSDGRAKAIAHHFQSLRVCPSPRAHNLYLGVLNTPHGPLDVASVASGMGCPSLDIIVNELVQLGVRRLLRVGTAGACSSRVAIGDLVIASGAVRDEHTSSMYVPLEYPSIADAVLVADAENAARSARASGKVHTGIVHSKDSLFAREFLQGPRKTENRRYMEILTAAGVLASEMESSHLFVLASVLSASLLDADPTAEPIRAGAILGIIGDATCMGTAAVVQATTDAAVVLALETARIHAARIRG
jgi:uridine phosphorylase